MKKNIIFYLLCFPFLAYGQADSTSIQFHSIENEDLALINSVNSVQFVSLSCSDTLVRGMKFFLSVSEYRNGQLLEENDLGFDCKEEAYPYYKGSDTLYFKVNPCDKIVYSKKQDSFIIKIAGKYQEETIKPIIKYPAMSIQTEWKSDGSYSLRQVHASKTIKIPLRTKIPVLVYTPPFNSGNFSSYCALGEEEIGMWYEKFKVKHYYVVNLEIK